MWPGVVLQRGIEKRNSLLGWSALEYSPVCAQHEKMRGRLAKDIGQGHKNVVPFARGYKTTENSNLEHLEKEDGSFQAMRGQQTPLAIKKRRLR